jgi:hypothetical protein
MEGRAGSARLLAGAATERLSDLLATRGTVIPLPTRRRET